MQDLNNLGHSLLFIKEDGNWSICNIIIQLLLKNHTVICMLDSQNNILRQANKLKLDFEEYVKKDMLIFASPSDFYDSAGMKVDLAALLHFLNSLIEKNAGNGNRGYILLGAPKSFLREGVSVIDYEMTLSILLERNIGLVCCYGIQTLRSLALKDIMSILLLHHGLLNDKGFLVLNTALIGEFLKSSIDRVLGVGVGCLIFKAIRVAYKTDDTLFLSNPQVLEDILNKMFGKSTETLVRRVLDELVNVLIK